MTHLFGGEVLLVVDSPCKIVILRIAWNDSQCRGLVTGLEYHTAQRQPSSLTSWSKCWTFGAAVRSIWNAFNNWLVAVANLSSCSKCEWLANDQT